METAFNGKIAGIMETRSQLYYWGERMTGAGSVYIREDSDESSDFIPFLKMQKFKWLICVTKTCCLSLILTAQNMMSIWSSFTGYLYLSANKILNLWFSKKLTKTSLSCMMILNCWIKRIFLLMQQILILSWKQANLQKQNDFSLTKGSIALTRFERRITTNWRVFCSSPEQDAQWEKLRSTYCDNIFVAVHQDFYSREMVSQNTQRTW